MKLEEGYLKSSVQIRNNVKLAPRCRPINKSVSLFVSGRLIGAPRANQRGCAQLAEGHVKQVFVKSENYKEKSFTVRI